MAETLYELKELLTLTKDATEQEIEDRFQNIAKLLFSSCAIKKGEDCYLFADIEFYYYNKSHKDIITHARNCDAMQWYINDFGGIDLTFESFTNAKHTVDTSGKLSIKLIINDECHFGGILLRELINASTKERLVGPYACAELFRMQDAISDTNTFPRLIEYQVNQPIPKPQKRWNLIRSNQKVEDKVKYLLSAYSNPDDADIGELVKAFKDYSLRDYRYKV